MTFKAKYWLNVKKAPDLHDDWPLPRVAHSPLRAVFQACIDLRYAASPLDAFGLLHAEKEYLALKYHQEIKHI